MLQDAITIVEDRLKLTVGTKVEHNDYTGFEFQPSARLAWKTSDLSQIGHMGDPRTASAEKGTIVVDREIAKLVEAFTQICKVEMPFERVD